MMRRVMACILLAGALPACARSIAIRGPNGETLQLIEDNSTANSIATRCEKANEPCPGRYAVLDAQQINGPIIAGQFGVTQGVSRQLMVPCQT